MSNVTYVMDESYRPCCHIIKFLVKGNEHLIECGDMPSPHLLEWFMSLDHDWEWGIYGGEIWAQFERPEDASYFKLSWS